MNEKLLSLLADVSSWASELTKRANTNYRGALETPSLRRELVGSLMKYGLNREEAKEASQKIFDSLS